MRIILHHLQIAIFIQVLLVDDLPQQLLTYPRGERILSLLIDASQCSVFSALPLVLSAVPIPVQL
jgi:hypothetical protein